MRAGAEAARAGEAGRFFNSGRGERDKGGVFQVVQAGERGGGSSRWLEAGGDVHARDGSNKTPFDYAKENAALKGTDVYWRLNEARFGRGD